MGRRGRREEGNIEEEGKGVRREQEKKEEVEEERGVRGAREDNEESGWLVVMIVACRHLPDPCLS